MRKTLMVATLPLLLAAFSLTQKAQAVSVPSAGAHYAGGAALVVYMFGGLDIFGLQAPKKTQSPSPLQEELQALASPKAKDLAGQSAAGSKVQPLRLEPSELLLLGKDRSLGRQIGR